MTAATRNTGKTGRKTRKARAGKARKVLARQTPKGPFPSDEESVAFRRARAEEEKAKVTPIEQVDIFFGTYEVSSAQWPEPYRVEIRSLAQPINTCSCMDHRMNRLGTCKHIERVLQHVSRRRKRRFAEAGREGSPLYEIFLDTRPETPAVRLLRPTHELPSVKRLLSPLFGVDGALISDPLDAMPSLERAVGRARKATRKRLRVSAAIAPWLDQARRRNERAQARASFLEDVREGKRTLDPVRLPLYPYQQEGMLHLAFGERAMLADEMGLGKTVQAIAACELLHQLRGFQRVLVVSPASLKAEWEDQIRQFTGRTSRLVFGPRATRLRTYREDHFFFLMNYEQVRNDVDDINRYLAPDIVILDEAQRIKNWPTLTAKTSKRLRSSCAFVLTGTPLENRIEEIYSLVEFIDPQLFGSLFRFQREFLDVDDDGNVGYRNMGELHRRVKTVMLRRRKDDVEGELPPRTVNTCFLPMEDEQRVRYEEYEGQASRLLAQAARRKLTRDEFEKLQRLLACMRMVCDTPYILDKDCRICPKLEELETILDEVLADPTAKVIIFSEWVRMLDLVKELVREKGIGFAEHTGKVDQRRRRTEIRRFKEDADCRLFLSSEAGGTGLNLQAANVVINLDLPWNPAKLEQRIARAWRKHQTRSVSVINLVTEHSIEQAMLKKLAFKAQLAEAVLDGHIPGGGLASGRGRKAFLDQVNALMGTRIETGEGVPEREKEDTPTPEQLRQDVTARFPSHVLGIEAAADRDAFLVVTRSGDRADEIREAAFAVLPDAAVEVVDAATYRLLRRLEEQGILAFTGNATPLFRSPELEIEHDEAPTAPRVFSGPALAHLETVDRKRKMAGLLAGGDLYAEALPPLKETFDVALDSLYLYYHGSLPDARPVEWSDPRFTGKVDELSISVFALQSRLNGCDPQSPAAPQVVRETLDAVDAVGRWIGRRAKGVGGSGAGLGARIAGVSGADAGCAGR